MNQSLLKLNLGCGTNKLDGWVNIDAVKDCNPDLVHDISQPLPYQDGTVDEILAIDLLEHFDKYMRYGVFYEWVRVLKVGGKIHLQVPNFPKIVWRYFKLDFESFLDFVFGEPLWNGEVYLGAFGSHKWGYSKKSLHNFAKLFRIKPLVLETKGLNIDFIGEKESHLGAEALDEIKIFSFPNVGIGKSYASLKTVKDRIKTFQQRESHKI
ncbi:MAG: methyltransferase domain-containing protein [Candidatus Omnitrophica bacterium]|nr:methyltransferase domain-containing protein [Candidatus Omnitrophota bacterium]